MKPGPRLLIDAQRQVDVLRSIQGELLHVAASGLPDDVATAKRCQTISEGARKEMRPTVRAWTRIVCQGRQRGIGITLVSQRSALVAKNVLTQTGSLLVLRTTSPQDRKVIRDWTDFHSVSAELVASLPGLANGEAWIVAPSWLGRVDRVRLRRRWTFDSGATPEVVSTRRAQMLDAADIDAIGQLLSGESSEEQPHELQPGADQKPSDGDQKEQLLALLGDGPRRAGDLRRETGLSIGRPRRLLSELAAEGMARMEGSRGGARWMLSAFPECADGIREEGEEADETGDSEPSGYTSGIPPACSENDESMLAERGVEVETAQAAASRLVDARAIAEDALQELDGILDSGSLTLLRARYIAALLKMIEAGDPDPALLDRFERAAGLA